jgi:hemerythrin-like domain-containing protein
MQQQCKQAKTATDLHRLASDILSFCRGLHAHHTIEDHRLFPLIARKIDISHLETHHEQLAQILIEFENFSRRLKQLKNTDEDINSAIVDAISMVNRVSALVNEHERAEEQVLEPANMKKWFTENEMKHLFNM